MADAIDKMLSTGQFDKKTIDKVAEEMLANICFSICDPILRPLYISMPSKRPMINVYTENVFKRVREAVKESHKANNYEEFYVSFLSPVEYLKDQLDSVNFSSVDITDSYSETELLRKFNENSEAIYTKYFKRKRRIRRKRKNDHK